MDIAARVEKLYYDGFGEGEKLTKLERASIIEWALLFDECEHTREYLTVMDDKDIVFVAVNAMVNHAWETE